MNFDTAKSETTSNAGAELLSVLIGDHDFAIDIMSVREIRGWIASTPLPHAPSYIKGMINLRGVILPIIDLAERLNFPVKEPSGSSVVVVVETAGGIVGMLVDAVSDIITVTDDMIQATPKTGSGVQGEMVSGLITLDSRIVGIISIDAIMPAGMVLTEVLAA
jgi:purine-binding chemotaxis protein CheW